jgi:hypothetical protein
VSRVKDLKRRFIEKENLVRELEKLMYEYAENLQFRGCGRV